MLYSIVVCVWRILISFHIFRLQYCLPRYPMGSVLDLPSHIVESTSDLMVWMLIESRFIVEITNIKGDQREGKRKIIGKTLFDEFWHENSQNGD